MSKVTNRRLVAQTGSDFYPTPSWATQALLKLEDIQGSILEPACGNGAMSEVLKTLVQPLTSSDLYDRGYGQSEVDFLDCKDEYDNVITNPPFNIAEDFVHKGLQVAKSKLILLLRLAFLESVGKYNSMYPEGSEVKSGGTTSYAWFVWDKQVLDKSTQLLWIPPGYKKKLKGL